MPDLQYIKGHNDSEVGVTMEIKFPIRMSGDLRERLKAEAKRSVRSMNGEILYRLQKSFDAEFGEPSPTDRREPEAA